MVAVERPAVTEALLDRIVRIIIDKLDPYEVILFGSYAWGEPNEDSDVDILVVTDRVFEWLADGEFARSGDLSISPNGWYSKPCPTCGGTGWVDADRIGVHRIAYRVPGIEFQRQWVDADPDGVHRVGCPDCGGGAYGERVDGRMDEREDEPEDEDGRGRGYIELSERREAKDDVRLAQLAAEVSLACRPRGLALDLIVTSLTDVERRLSIGDPFIKRIMDQGEPLHVR